MGKRLKSAEGQICGIFVMVLLVAVCVCLSMVSWPLLLALCLPAQPTSCQVYQLSTVQGVTNCSLSWSSCQPSCSSPSPPCRQVFVQHWLKDNSTKVVPLFGNVLGCGYDFSLTCSEFYEKFTTTGVTFECHVYENPDFATPDGENSVLVIIKYLVLSIIPLGALIICGVYMRKRNIFALGYKKKKKPVEKKPNEPKSFYQKKLMELEFKKRLRQLKMKNTQNDVKVFDLEQAQTTGALLLKPRFSHAMTQPPRIMI